MLHFTIVVPVLLASLLAGPAPAVEDHGVPHVPVYIGDLNGCSAIGDPDLGYCTVVEVFPDGTCAFRCKNQIIIR